MASLRIEYFAVSTTATTSLSVPLGIAVLAVTGTATAGGARPVVPGAALTPRPIGGVVVLLTAFDGAIYVATGASPDPATAGVLVSPSRSVRLQASPGDLLSAVTATDVPELFLGQVAGAGIWAPADAAKTRPNNATAYAANQAIGDASGCLFTFTNYFRKAAGGGYLNGRLTLAKAGGLSVPSGIAARGWLYSATPVSLPAADQAVFVMLDTNSAVRIGYIDFGSFVTGGAGSDVIESYGVPCLTPLYAKAAANARDLFMIVVATAAFTPTAQTVILPAVGGPLD